MNAVTQAAAASFAALKNVAGVRIAYAQTDPSPITVHLSAVLGRSMMVVDSRGGGGLLEALVVDFIVEVAELAEGYGNPPLTPTEGDIITIEESSRRYQVMTPPYTPSDHGGTRLRIHAKRITNA